jgi:hypothetical protein
MICEENEFFSFEVKCKNEAKMSIPHTAAADASKKGE